VGVPRLAARHHIFTREEDLHYDRADPFRGLLQPKLLRKPTIDAKGLLRVTGFFPTHPFQVNFDLMFQLVEAQWCLFGISVGTSRAQPVAIVPQPAPAQPPNASAPVEKQAPDAPGRER
jgi:hypothetical protein